MTQSLATTHVAPRDSQLLEFKSCGRHYACDLLWVKEVLRSPIVTPVSMAASYVRGVVHLRGQILTAFDLEDRLGHPSSPTLPQNRCIVFKNAVPLSKNSFFDVKPLSSNSSTKTLLTNNFLPPNLDNLELEVDLSM